MIESILAEISQMFSKHPYLKSLLASVIIVLLLYVINRIFIASFKRNKRHGSESNLITRRINLYTKYIAVLLIFLLWFSQLQGVLVSFLAVAAAIVLALKELIMCLTGGILLRSSNTFKTGDRIEIENIRGFVIERGLLATKVLEIGPEKNSQQTTGNIITFSNNLVFANTVKNESYFKGYSIKSYFFKAQNSYQIESLEKFLLKEGSAICEGYMEEAKRSISSFCVKEGIIIPSLDAKTKLIIDSENNFSILLRIPVKNSQIADVEQRLNRRFLTFTIDQVPQKV